MAAPSGHTGHLGERLSELLTWSRLLRDVTMSKVPSAKRIRSAAPATYRIEWRAVPSAR